MKARRIGLLATVVGAALLVFASQAAAAGCPNESLREAQGGASLPGCMALEMVSPPKKASEPAFVPAFSWDGERTLFTAEAALAGTPNFQNFGGDRYVATRTAAGWQVAPASPPLAEIVAGGRRYGGAAAFTPDLSRWNLLGATQSQKFVGVFQLFGGGLDGSFVPLSPPIAAVDNSGGPNVLSSVPEVEISASSTDLSTTVLRGKQLTVSYLPGDPHLPPGVQEEEPGEDRNSYVATLTEGGPALELLARDKDGPVYGGRCGAHLGGPLNVHGIAPTFIQGALSPGGQRAFFSTRPAQPFDPGTAEGPKCDIANPLRVMVRTATAAGPEIEPLLSGGLAEWQQPGDDFFQAASADGTKVYFASPRKLTASDTDASAQPCGATVGASKGCDLYLYDSTKPAGSRLTQVSAGEGPAPADVLTAVTAISGDGSHAYFVAQGVLTSDTSPSNTTAELGKPNLYAYDADSGQLAFLGTLAEDDNEHLWGADGSFFGDAFPVPLYGPGGPTEETGGDGHILAFASKAPLTADDGDGGHRDVFRYDADTDTLERISKAAPGGSDDGPFDASVNLGSDLEPESNFGEQRRWVGEGGQTIAFATAEPLAPADADAEDNPYVWRGGELGAAAAKVEFPPRVAPDGSEVAFFTRTALFPQDIDTAEDVYVAREGGGFPFPPAPPPPCNPLAEGGCQGAAPPPPAAGAPATVNVSSGNVRRSPGCKKGFVKKKGHCVKKTRHHRGKKRARQRGRASR